MTFPQVEELFTYWKSYPPVHEIALAFVKPGDGHPSHGEKENRTAAMTTPEEFEEFIKRTGGRLDGVRPF